MKTHARVVIIGAGIVGCSTAYYLAQMGWRDIVVLDQGPLFHNLGSTSHAPGLMFQHNNSRTVCRLAQWSVETYKQVAPEAVFQTGSLEIAHTPERWEELKRKIGNALAWGLDAHLVGPDEIKRMVPLMRTDDLYGAFYVPSDCDVKAAVICERLARHAEADGAAEFYAQTRVTGIEVDAARGRVRAVNTSSGRIETELVVAAAGLWGPVVGRMAGVALPMTPMQHLYVKTAPLKELAGETVEVRHPVVRYQDKDAYYRQHGEAYGFGSYRHDPLIVPAHHLPDNDHPAIFDFTPQHFEETWRDSVERFPCFAGVALPTRFNGLFSFTPDGNSLVGEAVHVRGFWAAEAVWVTHAGGVGRVVAEWLTEGRPSLDLRELDVNRFHSHAFSWPYIKTRAERQYIEVYDIVHPMQQMLDPRYLRVTPFHKRLQELGVMFVESAGWERPHWFDANAKLIAQRDWPSRSGWAGKYWSPIIGAEHRATRERVGLFDLNAFTKIEISGPGALAFLQYHTANQMDQPVGKITYTSMLDQAGGIVADLTVTRLAEKRFLVVTGGSVGMHDLAWLRQYAPDDGSVYISDVTSAYACLGLWGPRAREVAQSVSENDLSNIAFPYMTAQSIYVGYVPTLALRISYAGELGWELYSPTEYGLKLWDTLWEAGQAQGITAVGGAAFDSLRLEKGYRLWGAELHTEYNPLEAGIGFAVKMNKGDFMGRASLEKIKAEGLKRKLCCLVLDDPNIAIVGKEPILTADGQQVLGYVTSANYGYTVRQSLAYGYLPLDHASPGAKVQIYYFGHHYPATVGAEPLYDPENSKLKA